MAHTVRPARAYIFARASINDRGRWLADVLRRLADSANLGEIDVVDELRVNAEGDVASAVIKVAASVSETALQEALDNLRLAVPDGVCVEAVGSPAAGPSRVRRDECEVDYFRREFADDSYMVHHTDSCVRLTHLPTSTSVRSTLHRSRHLNESEAYQVLEALLSHEP